MSARARAGSLVLMKAGACMKPDFALFGVLLPPLLVTARSHLREKRDDMGFYGKQWKSLVQMTNIL
jgi:hypothetical protein